VDEQPYKIERGWGCWVIVAPWNDQVYIPNGDEAEADCRQVADLLNDAYARGKRDAEAADDAANGVER
jgi:hypothetical protein